MRIVNSATEFQSILQQHEKVFVDFFAEWCGPCKEISPILEKQAGGFPNITFVKVDVDNNPDSSQEAKVTAMPTFVAYYKGKEFERLVGANDTKLLELIAKLNGHSA